jgi:hypothetical protein
MCNGGETCSASKVAEKGSVGKISHEVSFLEVNAVDLARRA